MENSIAPVIVVIVPVPAQGHLNSLLHFTRHLSERGLPVHFVSSATHNHQAKLRSEGWGPLNVPAVHFHDLPLPSYDNLSPNPNAPTNFPDHLVPALEASAHLRQPFGVLLRALSPTARRVIVVHESLTSFAGLEAALVVNAESYLFYNFSALFVLLLMTHLRRETLNLGLPPISLDAFFSQRFLNFFFTQVSQLANVPTSGNIWNTCHPLEAQFLHHLAQGPKRNSRIFAIGPVNQGSTAPSSEALLSRRHWCMDWLDSQPENSVIYVSFGTTSTFFDAQIAELAAGLERSEHRFLWVLREADRCDLFRGDEDKSFNEVRKLEVLLQGFEERVKERGVVVRDWAPQLEILGHSSVGAFMSHCGWNSCMESISMGVPLAAWPLHSDQPTNAVLVTMVLKIGVMVRDLGNHDGVVVDAERVEEVVKTLMGAEQGVEMRKRAGELGAVVAQLWSEGGESRADFDSFVDHIMRT